MFFRLTAAATTFVAVFAAVAAPAPAASVTYSGSGRVGVTDGLANSASFVLPAGISPRRDGSLLVADAGAQRIRVVDRGGAVRTLAGSGALDASGLRVRGGYVDGPAAVARFSQPLAAVDLPDGAVAVADAQNHCVRLVRQGVVTTLTGSPRTYGSRDGTLARAVFRLPRGLAVAGNGDLYVADFGNGVRRIHDGRVTTLRARFLSRGIVSVAIARTGWGEQLLVTDGTRVEDIRLADGAFLFGWSPVPDDKLSTDVLTTYEGDQDHGFPAALAVYPATDRIGPAEFVFPDARAGVVHYVHNQFDGTLPAYAAARRFVAPDGAAVLPDGRVVVADGGGRRLVVLDPPDRRSYAFAQTLPPAIPERTFRVAYLSNSFVQDNAWWDDAVPGILERRLRGAVPGETTQVYAVRTAVFSGIRDFVANVLDDGLANAVVLQVNDNTIYSTYTAPSFTNLADSEGLWRGDTIAQLSGLVAGARAAGLVTMLVYQPTSAPLAPLEMLGGYVLYGAGADEATDWTRSTAAVASAVAAAGADCTLDLTPSYLAAEREPHREALFQSDDIHFSPAGIRLTGAVLGDALATCLRTHAR